MEQRVIEKHSEEREGQPRIGVYVCHCGLNIAKTVDCSKVAESAARLDDVVVSKNIEYACSEPGQQQIKDDIAEEGIDRVVIASCSPRLHEPTFRQMLQSSGLNPHLKEAHHLLGFCFFKLGDYREAVQCFERVIELDPGSGIDYANLGINLSRLGHAKEAAYVLRQALDLDPTLDFARQALEKLES